MEKSVVHLGIEMDGNRRWTENNGFAGFEGHRRGGAKIKEVISWSAKRGIKFLTLYALSVENLKRSEREVNFLMQLAGRFINENTEELRREGARVMVLGRREGLPTFLVKRIAEIEKATQGNDKITVNVLFNYGGRQEIAEAVKRIVLACLSPSEVTKECIEKYLWTSGQPDPDLVIRTSGEQRLSNFLIWQTAYAEFYVCPKYWPDFTEADLDEALAEYGRRQRRFGK